jgi:hypothetical protein
LRPCDSPSWIVSRYSSQALADVWRLSSTGTSGGTRSVVTSMAGFEKHWLKERFSVPESVVTCMAGFAPAFLFHPPGRPTAIPAAFR